MKAILYLIATLMLATYSCVVMAFSLPTTIEPSPMAYSISEPTNDLSTECQYSTLDVATQSAMRGEDWNQMSWQLRVRMEQQKQIWQHKTLGNIRSSINNFAQQCNIVSKLHILLSNHIFIPSLKPPCRYYIFAMRHILA